MTQLLNKKIRQTIPGRKSMTSFQLQQQVKQMQQKVIELQSELIRSLKKNVEQSEKISDLQHQILIASHPPLKMVKEDWWENHKPDTNDEIIYLKAKVKWLNHIREKYLRSYVDPAALAVFANGLGWRVVNDAISDYEVEAEEIGRGFEMLAKARSKALRE